MGKLEEQMIFPLVEHNRTPSCLPQKFKGMHYNFPNKTVISILGQLLESSKSCETGKTPPITPYAPRGAQTYKGFYSFWLLISDQSLSSG
ncbi:hypothetical protein H4Q26_002278 [Puccinia striiformis f. sp. tritici PST-130]|nr:hypothetical protein H4Q26_002278 [Puccinia striiformis f. sp. tritici PST-130]